MTEPKESAETYSEALEDDYPDELNDNEMLSLVKAYYLEVRGVIFPPNDKE